VLQAVKAQQVSGVAKDVARLLGPQSALVTLQIGVPWWFFHKLKGPNEGRPVHAADPYGVIAESIAPSHMVGAVVYPAAELVAPGVAKVIEGDRFTLGEPDGSNSDRARSVSEALTRAGCKAPVSGDIRAEIWLKLWGDVAFSPTGALTTVADICQFPPTRALAAR
jgi:2-dehydropantoate 2-reductase